MPENIRKALYTSCIICSFLSIAFCFLFFFGIKNEDGKMQGILFACLAPFLMSLSHHLKDA
jgi:hypothetical protein